MRRVFSEGDVDGQPRDLYISSVESLERWPGAFQPAEWPVSSDAGFALLVAGDLTGADEGDGRWCIGHKLFDLSAWGDDCERVHDIFDQVDISLGAPTTQPVVMTAWHANESFSDATDFFWDCSIAVEGKVKGPARIALLVGRSPSEVDVEAWAADRAGG